MFKHLKNNDFYTTAWIYPPNNIKVCYKGNEIITNNKSGDIDFSDKKVQERAAQ